MTASAVSIFPARSASEAASRATTSAMSPRISRSGARASVRKSATTTRKRGISGSLEDGDKLRHCLECDDVRGEKRWRGSHRPGAFHDHLFRAVTADFALILRQDSDFLRHQNVRLQL